VIPTCLLHRQQLPAEAKRFDGVDKAWLKIMADTAKSSNVLEACGWGRRRWPACRLAEATLPGVLTSTRSSGRSALLGAPRR
jgi:hypothetical protein